MTSLSLLFNLTPHLVPLNFITPFLITNSTRGASVDCGHCWGSSNHSHDCDFSQDLLFNPYRIFSTVIYRCCYAQSFRLLKSGKKCLLPPTSQSSPLMIADTETPTRLCQLTIMSSPPALNVIEAYVKRKYVSVEMRKQLSPNILHP